jgi:hypothetical protein
MCSHAMHVTLGTLLLQIMKKLVAAGNDARIGAIITKLAEVDVTTSMAATYMKACSGCPM